MKMLQRRFLILFFISFALSACSPEATLLSPPIPVTLQLKWVNQAQFAGFYVAADKGYYAEENIDITFSPGGPGINILDEVTSRRAQFGLIGPEKIIVARDEGLPIKAIATIYRRNPFVLVSMPGSGILQPADMLGKKIGIGGNDGLVQFTAMMARLRLDINQVTIVPYVYGGEPLFSGEVDVIPAFAAGSLLAIENENPDVNLIWPEDYGIHFYSDTLFTTDQLIAENPDLILRFLRASLKGHQYTIENPDEAVQISLKYAVDADPVVQMQMMIASLPLINTGEDYIGWMKPEVWAGMEQTLREQGTLTAPVDVSQVYVMQFLEDIYK